MGIYANPTVPDYISVYVESSQPVIALKRATLTTQTNRQVRGSPFGPKGVPLCRFDGEWAVSVTSAYTGKNKLSNKNKQPTPNTTLPTARRKILWGSFIRQFVPSTRHTCTYNIQVYCRPPRHRNILVTIKHSTHLFAGPTIRSIREG